VADAAWAAVSDEIEAIEEALSRFRETSDLTLLNRAATGALPGATATHAVDGRLVRALVAARRAWRITGGRFDPRVLADLDRLGYRGAEVGTSDGVGEVDPSRRPRPDREWLCADSRSGRAAVETPVDLGGIGKGLALRWAGHLLERTLAAVAGGAPPAGAARAGAATENPREARPGFLLEAGGDLVGRGGAPGGGPWLIGIDDPRAGTATTEPLAVIAVADGAAATSSVAVHRWRIALDGNGSPSSSAGRSAGASAGRSVGSSPDREIHHLIDPRTGEPGGSGLLAVTVVGPDPAWAEVWSKTLFLAGRSGIADAARSRGLAAWWVDETGALAMTPAARRLTAWEALAAR
jgi:thiamine biosynthesis lipoprotein